MRGPWALRMGGVRFPGLVGPIPSVLTRMFTLLFSAALVAPLGLISGPLQTATLAEAQATAEAVPMTAAVDEVSPELERALAAISAANASADLHFLASDELGGRDTPSVGQRIAARFIAARMERLGLTPAGNRGYMADFQLMRGALDPAKCSAELMLDGKTMNLSVPADYAIDSGRGSASVGTIDLSGGAVFAGMGTEEDFKGLDLSGKWALCLTSRDISWRVRAKAAKAAGAIGLLNLTGGERDLQSFTRRAERSVSRLAGSAKRLTSYAPVWPMVTISPSHFDRLLPQGAETVLGTVLGFTWHAKRGLTESSELIDLENVAALWPGSDPEIGKEVIIISAHYDHVGTDGEDIYNGADDNGSGTTGMLQIAEALVAAGPLRRSVLLLWVSGEEKGLLGSNAWTLDPTLPAKYIPVCNLNIDMIGRNAPDYLMITPTKELPQYNGIVSRFETLAPLEGFPTLANADQYYNRSDQANFAKNMGIPVAFLFSDIHEDYHKPTDTADKIDYDKLARISRLVVRMIFTLQDNQLGV